MSVMTENNRANIFHMKRFLLVCCFFTYQEVQIMTGTCGLCYKTTFGVTYMCALCSAISLQNSGYLISFPHDKLASLDD